MAVAWNQVFNEASPNQVRRVWPKRAEQLRDFSRDLGAELQLRQITNVRSGFTYDLPAVQAPDPSLSVQTAPAPEPHVPTAVPAPDLLSYLAEPTPQAPSQAVGPAAAIVQQQDRPLSLTTPNLSALTATDRAASGPANVARMPMPAPAPCHRNANPSALAAAQPGPSQPQSQPILKTGAPTKLQKDLVPEDGQVQICPQCMARNAWAKHARGLPGRFEDEPVVFKARHTCPNPDWIKKKDAEILGAAQPGTSPSLPSKMVSSAQQQLARRKGKAKAK